MLKIDRFEDGVAVICGDSNAIYTVPRVILPINAREGDVIRLTAVLDRRATGASRRAAKKALKDFFQE